MLGRRYGFLLLIDFGLSGPGVTKPLGRQDLALAHEGAHHIHAHFHGLRRSQNIGGLNGAMLGEGEGQGLGKLEPGEVVAICDHLLPGAA